MAIGDNGEDGGDDLVIVNTDLSRLKKALRDSASFLDRQSENEKANIAFAKSDWMQGLCEGKSNAYDLASKIIMNNLEVFGGKD